MSKRNISNYALAILLTFAITSFGLTYFVFPSYAAPTLTTFFSCETTDGCGYRYNSTLYLAPLPNNMTQIGDWSTSQLVYEMAGNETIIINGSAIGRTSANALLHLSYTPAVNGTMGLHIIADMNGQPNIEVLEIQFNASSLINGNPVLFNALIDRGASTGGMIHALSVSAVGSGSAEIEALGVFSGIIPIHQHSGAPANMDRALLYTGSFSDVTAAFTATGNDTSMFVSNGDSVYVGHASQFSEIQFNLDTLASGAGVKPIFEFSTGGGGWTVFSPIDATDGFRDDGGIDFEPSSLTGWATDTVSGFVNNFWVRINRTQGGLGTVPIEDLVQIVVGTEFIWDENGNVQIFGMNVTDALRVTGITHLSDDLRIASGKSIVSNAGGFPDIVTFTYPITINWNGTWAHDFNSATMNNLGASCNDMGNPNAFCASSFSGIVDMLSGTIDNVLVFRGETGGGSGIYINEGANVRFRLLYDTGSNNADFYTENAVASLSRRFRISAETATAEIQMSNANFAVPTNNTLSMFSDAVRVADIYSVNDHAKVQITGILIEGDILPLPIQYNLFEDGDVVCAADEIFYFKLCDQIGDELILGVVHLLPRINVTGVDENGNLTYGIVGYDPMLMIEGPKYIKICSPVERGELLIAGNDGCAKGVNTLSGTTTILGVNIPNRILARDRAFAIAWEDSSGPMAAVHVRAS